MEVEKEATTFTEEEEQTNRKLLHVQGIEPGEGKRMRRDRASTAKERISQMPPCTAGKRSSIYRGVTRHRWTGRYEAHLWDKGTWNQNQNKKGKQVYLAARVYDLAALKYWGPGTLINFPERDYARDIDEMQHMPREDYLVSLRRKSSGFSRGLSKLRGCCIRNPQNGRWNPQMGNVLTSDPLHLSSQDSTLEFKGASSLSNLLTWLQPVQPNARATKAGEISRPKPETVEEAGLCEEQQQALPMEDDYSQVADDWRWQFCEPYRLPTIGFPNADRQMRGSSSLSLLFRSSKFKEMLERVSMAVAGSQRG
eukprot:c19528_g1_i1 orf=284-1213(+)